MELAMLTADGCFEQRSPDDDASPLSSCLKQIDVRTLYIGFKGTHNASCVLENCLSGSAYLLTNSFDGVQRDIASLDNRYDCVIMFGIATAFNES